MFVAICGEGVQQSIKGMKIAGEEENFVGVKSNVRVYIQDRNTTKRRTDP
jgi:hypothetical protein